MTPHTVVNTFFEMVRKQLLVMIRYPVNFVASFFQVFLIVAVFTFAVLAFVPEGPDGAGRGNGGVVAYGFILFLFLSDVLWTFGGELRQEQYQGTLEALYLTPASKFASLLSRVSVTVVWTGLLSVAAIVLMTILIGRVPFHNFGLGLIILLLSISGIFGLGFAFAAYTLLVRESAQMTANLLQFTLLVICGMFFPFSALPEAVLRISRLVPLSYCVDALRSTWMDFPPGFPELAPIQMELVIVGLFGLLMPLLGYWLFRWAERQVRMNGTLGEY
jgi:ABC-2 type transport system permease protein